jgi:hypothetical protein
MGKPLTLLVVIVSLLLAPAGCGGGNSGQPMPTPPPGLPTPDHVFLIVLENHSFSQVIGGAAMPYFNSLATQYSLAANYFANTHPSIGNYFMLTTGQIVTNDDNFAGTFAGDNLALALAGAGKTWKSYVESLPSVGYTGDAAYPYLKRHNPFAYFTDVINSPPIVANMVPFSEIFSDLSAGSLPSFAFIAPNAQNDAHDCPGGGTTCTDADKLAAADSWLQTNIDPLITNPALANSVFIITWDESTDPDTAHGGGQIATVLVGSHVRSGFRSTTFYQHQNTLRLILDLLRVSDHPGGSAAAAGMSEFFQ